MPKTTLHTPGHEGPVQSCSSQPQPHVIESAHQSSLGIICETEFGGDEGGRDVWHAPLQLRRLANRGMEEQVEEGGSSSAPQQLPSKAG